MSDTNAQVGGSEPSPNTPPAPPALPTPSAPSKRGWAPEPQRAPDEFSPVLGKSQQQWEKEMRVWYVLLGIVCFFAVFGEGILVMVSKRRDAREKAQQTQTAAPPTASPTAPPTPSPRADSAH